MHQVVVRCEAYLILTLEMVRIDLLKLDLDPLKHTKIVWVIGITTHTSDPILTQINWIKSGLDTTCSPSLYYKI